MSEEELKHYVDQYFEKYWSVSFDKFLENMEESDEIREWALKEVKRLKNKNEELKDQLEFSKLSNPEMNLRYSKLVNSNRRKINCLREENKKLKEQLRQKENIIKACNNYINKLKDQLDFSNNIINELEKWLEQEYAIVKANSIQEHNNPEWYIKWNERKNTLDKLLELKDQLR